MDDRIDDDLAGAVIGGLASTVRARHGDAARSPRLRIEQDVTFGRVAAERDGRRMLDLNQRVRGTTRFDVRRQCELAAKGFGVPDAPPTLDLRPRRRSRDPAGGTRGSVHTGGDPTPDRRHLEPGRFHPGPVC
jgi:hypothetical protein